MIYRFGGPNDPYEPGYEVEWEQFHSNGTGQIIDSEWQLPWLCLLVEILDAAFCCLPTAEIRLYGESGLYQLSIARDGEILPICYLQNTVDGVREAEPVIWQKLVDVGILKAAKPVSPP